MSDEAIRAAERAYRSSGSPADGEAWVQAVLRTTGVNSTFLIARVIETQRALHALGAIAAVGNPGVYLRADIRGVLNQPVTSDDIVDFLRGGRNWLQPGMAESAAFGAESIREEIDREIVADLIRELPAIHPAQADPHAHLPYQRGVPRGSAILCDHANENPGHCTCDPDCYCRQDGHTCGPEVEFTRMVRHHEAVDGDVRHCANGPCGKAMPVNHPAIYCSARCALNDS